MPHIKTSVWSRISISCFISCVRPPGILWTNQFWFSKVTIWLSEAASKECSNNMQNSFKVYFFKKVYMPWVEISLTGLQAPDFVLESVCFVKVPVKKQTAPSWLLQGADLKYHQMPTFCPPVSFHCVQPKIIFTVG